MKADTFKKIDDGKVKGNIYQYIFKKARTFSQRGKAERTPYQYSISMCNLLQNSE